ncbi:MAG: pantetheine-phosphate adenylyltransferase [Acidobacteriota bacterium]
MAERVIAIYPGSFDPVTNGHLDIIERSSSIFDSVIVAVLINVAKQPLFSIDERLEMLRDVTGRWENVEVASFEGLLVNYAVSRKAHVILRGIRAVTDYDYEFQMALMNRRMQPTIETIFMVPAEAYSYLSSSMVKEVCALGGSVSGLVPSCVEASLKHKFQKKAIGQKLMDKGKEV